MRRINAGGLSLKTQGALLQKKHLILTAVPSIWIAQRTFASLLLFWIMIRDKTLEVKKAVTKTTLIIFQRSPTLIHMSENMKDVLSTHRPEAPFLWKPLKATAIHKNLSYSFPHTFTPWQSTFYQPDARLGRWCSVGWDMGSSLWLSHHTAHPVFPWISTPPPFSVSSFIVYPWCLSGLASRNWSGLGVGSKMLSRGCCSKTFHSSLCLLSKV